MLFRIFLLQVSKLREIRYSFSIRVYMQKRKFVSPSGHEMFVYVNTNEIPNNFTQLFFFCERYDLLCNQGNGYLLTCKDIMFSCEHSPGVSLVVYIINGAHI